MPVILATQEAEIRQITVQSQPRQNSSQDRILKKKKNHEKGLVEWLKVGPEFKPQHCKKKKKMGLFCP
jgi:hypothetical protein